MSNLATIDSLNPKIAPTLSQGKITPEVLHRWERACKEFFRVKGMKDERKVESVLSRIEDLRLADWIEAHEEELRVLTFPAFMEKLRDEALEVDWDRKIKLALLASKQREHPFDDWAYGMIARNTLLRGRPDHFSDAALRETLGNNVSPVLELRVRKARIAKDISLRKWIEEVKLEDDFMTWERELTRGWQGRWAVGVHWVRGSTTQCRWRRDPRRARPPCRS